MTEQRILLTEQRILLTEQRILLTESESKKSALSLTATRG